MREDADATNARVDKVRRDLAGEDVEPAAARVSPAAAATVPTGEVRPRPPSLQADEARRFAAPGEHPPYGTAAPSDTMGTRHVEVALADLLFPMTKKELLARAGNWRIPVTGRVYRTLADYVAPVEDDEFRSPADVGRAIERAWSRGHHT